MREIEFRDFIKLQRGFDLPRKDMLDGFYPVVGSTSVVGWHNEYKQDPPGVVTGRSGSLGVVQYIKEKYWPHNTSLWVKDYKGNHPRYVYYFLQNFPLAHFNSGAGVPTLNRNDLDVYKIQIHTYAGQLRVASILSAYDDLIDNNIRHISILEQMAQTIYDEWFVKFRFPGHNKVKIVDSELGKIPEGWSCASLNDIVERMSNSETTGEHLYHLPYVPIDCIPRKSLMLVDVKSGTEAKSSLISFDENDILFGAMRPYFHKVVIVPFKGITRTTCFVLRTRKQDEFSYSVLTLFQDSTIKYATKHSKGATIPYASWDDSLSSMKIKRPPKNLLQNFNNLVSPILEKVKITYFIISNLKQTRDLLIPKLLSGEIDVEDMDIDIGDVD